MKSASSVNWVICPGGAIGAFNSVLKGWFGFQIHQQVFCISIYQFNFKQPDQISTGWLEVDRACFSHSCDLCFSKDCQVSKIIFHNVTKQTKPFRASETQTFKCIHTLIFCTDFSSSNQFYFNAL